MKKLKSYDECVKALVNNEHVITPEGFVYGSKGRTFTLSWLQAEVYKYHQNLSFPDCCYEEVPEPITLKEKTEHWWKNDYGRWRKCESYEPDDTKPYLFVTWKDDEWFNGREHRESLEGLE